MPQRLSLYFAANHEMRAMARKAQQLTALQEQYQQLVPRTLAHASQVIGLEHHILTIGATNSAAAAKLRQLAPQLASLLQRSGLEVTGILVKVQVAPPLAARTLRRHCVGAEGRRHIADLAAALPDSPLKSAILRLASAAKPDH